MGLVRLLRGIRVEPEGEEGGGGEVDGGMAGEVGSAGSAPEMEISHAENELKTIMINSTLQTS